jgi:hypothetical protein
MLKTLLRLVLVGTFGLGFAVTSVRAQDTTRPTGASSTQNDSTTNLNSVNPNNNNATTNSTNRPSGSDATPTGSDTDRTTSSGATSHTTAYRGTDTSGDGDNSGMRSPGWGWIGLVGLVGLLGLMPRGNENTVRAAGPAGHPTTPSGTR